MDLEKHLMRFAGLRGTTYENQRNKGRKFADERKLMSREECSEQGPQDRDFRERTQAGPGPAMDDKTDCKPQSQTSYMTFYDQDCFIAHQ
jgi:hypothetical protein